MHIPDGFLNPPVAIAGGVVAIAAITLSVRGARRSADDRTAPLAGLAAAFIFAAQMINFPVAAGTSGHLLGGALAAVLLGPYLGLLAVTTVIVIQGLVFADGGLSALGLNITNLALVTTLVGWLAFKGMVSVLPRGRISIIVSATVGAFLSVPAAALAFSLEYAIGGTESIPAGQVLRAMTGIYSVIGVGEAVITGLVVGAVLSTRPDLIYGARGRLSRPSPVATSAKAG